jgi:hypothetical protein
MYKDIITQDQRHTSQVRPLSHGQRHATRDTYVYKQVFTPSAPGGSNQSSPATRHRGAWGERRYSSYSFMTSALDGVSGQLHAPAALCPRERTPSTHCTGGWVGLRAGLDTEVRGKILCPCRESNPDRPVVQSVIRLNELPRLLPGGSVTWKRSWMEWRGK